MLSTILETTMRSAVTFAGTTYDLSHLDPFTVTFEQPAQDGKPARHYTVDVSFENHCFTRGIKPSEVYDRDLELRYGREVRLFDARRYELSKHLPCIIKGLVGQTCKFGDRSNFYRLTSTTDTKEDYPVFFAVTKSSLPGRINLFVQSAYIRSSKKLPASRTIRFEIILFNTLHGKPLMK